MERTIPGPTRNAALVLSSPELINIITSSLKRSDTVQLSQTCRLMFGILLLTIWKHVNSAMNLLRLVKPSSSHMKKRPGNPHEIVCACV